MPMGGEDTVSDTDRPTQIDPSEITQTSPNNAPPKTTHPEGRAKRMKATRQRRAKDNRITLKLHREMNRMAMSIWNKAWQN